MKTRYKKTISIKEAIKAHKHLILYFNAVRKSIDHYTQRLVYGVKPQ